MKNKTFKKRTGKINKRKYKKTFRKKANMGFKKYRVTRKLRGGDFNNEQKQELYVLLENKGLNTEQINVVMQNLNNVSQIFSSKFWFERIKNEIGILGNYILDDGKNSIIRWSEEVDEQLRHKVETDDEDN